MTDVGQKKFYMLNDLIGRKVLLHGKKIGKLCDLIIKDGETLATVTHVYVSRSFGDPSLLIPWSNVKLLALNEIIVDIPDVKTYEREIDETLIKLKDYVLDKKVLDTEGRDVDVVYDIRLVFVNDQLFVSDVDISNSSLLRRVGLGWLGAILGEPPEKSKLIPWKFIQSLQEPLGRFKGDLKLKILKEKLEKIHPIDLADILEELDSKQRVEIFEELGTEKASATLGEIDPKSQRELISAMKKEKIAQLFKHMTAGQVADVLSAVPYTDATTILQLLEENHVKKIRAIMEKREEEIFNYSTSKFIRFPPNMTVEEARKQYLDAAKDKKVVMYIYIVDEKDKLLGVIDIKELLEADGKKKLKDVKKESLITFKQDTTFHHALKIFDRYDYRAVPIIDNDNKIIGVIQYRDLKKIKHRFLE